MKERYNDGQCVVEGLAGEELRQIVASPDTGEAGDTRLPRVGMRRSRATNVWRATQPTCTLSQ